MIILHVPNFVVLVVLFS